MLNSSNYKKFKLMIIQKSKPNSEHLTYYNNKMKAKSFINT